MTDGMAGNTLLNRKQSAPFGLAAAFVPEPQLLGDRAPLPDVRPREMRTPPLGQSNLLDRALSSFGQPSLDALRRGYAGEATPQEVARTFLETGPMGPFGAVRVPNPIRAYHGSPHDFDEFRLDRVGTGEGAQAYGQGLYFAEHPAVAGSYRVAGTGRTPAYSRHGDLNEILVRRSGDINKVIDDIKKELSSFEQSRYRGSANHEGWKEYLALAERYKRGDPELLPLPENAPGRMYEVNLHARPEQFLDWDRPLSGQPAHVRDYVNSNYPLLAAQGRQGFSEMGGDELGRILSRTPDAANAGIPGIRYLDQGSRRLNPRAQPTPRFEAAERAMDQMQTAVERRGGDIRQLWDSPEWRAFETERNAARQASIDEQATSNYVVFSPEIIEILRKYGIAAPVAGATTAEMLSQYGDNK